MGLRSMYFLLAGIVERFHYLRLGLAMVLTFIGVKMLIVIGHVEIPITVSLAIVVTVLVASVAASLIWPKELVRATKVRLEGNPPVFVLSGSGVLAHLVIYRTKHMNGDDEYFALWEIEPVDGYVKGRPIEDIGNIQYGLVPKGYRQCCPEAGAPPPTLKPGTKYEYWFDTTDAPHARNCFVIRGNRAVEVVD
jgi:hypothetical protein